MEFFGEPWDAPVCEDTAQAPTPTGQLCFDCKIPIKDGDRGFLIPYLPADGAPTVEAWHFRCFARGVQMDMP